MNGASHHEMASVCGLDLLSKILGSGRLDSAKSQGQTVSTTLHGLLGALDPSKRANYVHCLGFECWEGLAQAH